MQQQGRWQISHEHVLSLFLPQPIDLVKQQQCWQLAEHIQQHAQFAHRVVETVVGMNTLSVYTTDLNVSQLQQLQQELQQLSDHFVLKPQQTGKHVDIPVCYGGEFGPDLKAVAEMKNLSIADVVKLHTDPIYTVYFIGFQVGFPYLGGLDERLFTPRHTQPRLSVPAGSVGIGGQQTGIYPFSSPGGWQLLGKTEIALFDLQKNPATLLQAGDTLRFVAEKIIED